VGFFKVLDTFLFDGPKGISKLVRSYGPCKLASKYEVIQDIPEFPEKAYISCHHRRPTHDLDFASLFLYEPYFEKFRILTSIEFLKGLPPRVADWIGYRAIQNVNLLRLATTERFQCLVDLMDAPRSAVAVYPARDGMQYFGDMTYTFRDGLFAASLYTQVPIVNILTLEPTAIRPWALFVANLWVPPSVSKVDLEGNLIPFSDWRSNSVNKKSIALYKRTCEDDHKARTLFYESISASCAPDDEFKECKPDPRIEGSIQRNTLAIENFSKTD
jgi:hypothetical protein